MVGIFMALAMSGCASKAQVVKSDDGSYDRANNASAKALDKLDKE